MNYDQTLCVYTVAQQCERTYIRKRAWFVGIGMLVTLLMQYVMVIFFRSFLMQAESVMTHSVLNRLAYYAIYGGYYVAIILLPVALCALLFRVSPRLPQEQQRSLEAPTGVLVALFGMGFCVLANYIANYWLVFAAQFGVERYQGDYHAEVGWLPFVLNLIAYALLPAIVEELVFRGWYMAALQPSGERCALITSALLFGLAHGNLTQMPFTFLLGLLFGWLVLRTGRLWPSMLIHFLNNTMSVVFDSLGAVFPDSSRVVQLAVYAGIVLAGAVAGILLAVRRDFLFLTRPLCDRRRVLSVRSRRRLVVFNPAIFLTVVVYGGLLLLGELVK